MLCASNQFPATTKQIHITNSAVKNPLGPTELTKHTTAAPGWMNLSYYPLLGWKQTTNKIQ